jgi:hypothetical protein
MRTKRWLLAASAVTLVGLAAATWWALSPRPCITEDSFTQITSGSTLEEAEAIIGAPPGNYGGVEITAYAGGHGWADTGWEPPTWLIGSPQVRQFFRSHRKELGEFRSGRIVAWTGPRNAIVLQLDEHDHVVGGHFGIVDDARTWWGMVLHTLGIR